MRTNPILSAPAVREARRDIEARLDAKHTHKWWEDAQGDLDAYAAAVLAEAKRRVEALDIYTEFPDGLATIEPDLRDTALKRAWDLCLDRAAVLRVLDGAMTQEGA